MAEGHENLHVRVNSKRELPSVPDIFETLLSKGLDMLRMEL